MERSTIVRVHEGLHARPATRFVRLAKSFEADVEIVKDGKAVSAKSSVKLDAAFGQGEPGSHRSRQRRRRPPRPSSADRLSRKSAGGPGRGRQRRGRSPALGSAPAAVLPEVAALEDGKGRLRGIAASGRRWWSVRHSRISQRNHPAAAHAGAAQDIDGEIERLGVPRWPRCAAIMTKALADASLAESDRAIVAALMDIAGDEALIGHAEGLVRQGMDAVSAVIGATEATAAEVRAVEDRLSRRPHRRHQRRRPPDRAGHCSARKRLTSPVFRRAPC